MGLSKWIGKRVKHTRKPPNNDVVSVGILQKTRTGHYEIKMDGGGYAATFNGDTVECNGKKIIVKY